MTDLWGKPQPTNESTDHFFVTGDPVWIFGAGGFGRSLAKACLSHGLEVLGFIQTHPQTSVLDGLPVFSWNETPGCDRSIPLLIGIFNRDTPLDSLRSTAYEAGFSQVCMPWNYYGQLKEFLGWRYWLESPKTLLAYEDSLAWCYDRLADDTSRTCLRRCVSFRLGLDLNWSSFRHPEDQYFNQISIPSLRGRHISYVDGGAYIGDSFRKLLTSYPDFAVQCAWLFEPDSSNYAQMIKAVRTMDVNCFCVPLGLSDRAQILSFSGGVGEAGRFDADGNGSVATVGLDELLGSQEIDFIKLDIEGAEAEALRGAARIIDKHRPVLAISCYHKPNDLWELPQLIDQLANGYKLFLRQHAYNSFDSVLYGVPE